eukprot:TRINITY_DN3533_c0_g1_i2.p1 TRINITY_DN3533_c0_g1~~TRINITY_DN3533_c0_g1_i2.p1  ORF type:complete len:215 (+),score=54.53 TRINITY_DN3533_c0_g1_i2:88-732(+)
MGEVKKNSGYIKIPGMATKYQILEPGSGPSTVKGSKIQVHAYGVVENETRRPFWNTRAAGGAPYEFVAGAGNVIRGWDMGVIGMQVGEVRRILIPDHEGYGKAGYPAWRIKPGSVLSFRIELLSIQGAAGGGGDAVEAENAEALALASQKRPADTDDDPDYKRPATAMGKVAMMLNAAAAAAASAQCSGNDDDAGGGGAPAAAAGGQEEDDAEA